jgi:hypothetical protein
MNYSAKWHEEQERLYGCRYVNGECTVHGATSVEPQVLLCTCQSFSNPHELEEHDALPGRFAGDTELKKFEDCAPTDWRGFDAIGKKAGKKARKKAGS